MKSSRLLLSFQLSLVLIGSFNILANAQAPTAKEVDGVYSDAHALYLDLHQNPELSGHETQTAEKLAARWRAAGYDVTEHVGGAGVVAILKNGVGPTIMLRTELDALPVEEKTGLPYASKVRAKDDAGEGPAVSQRLPQRSALRGRGCRCPCPVTAPGTSPLPLRSTSYRR